MKKAFLIVSLLLLFGGAQLAAQSAADLVDLCAASAGEDAIYQQDFQVELEAAKSGEKQIPAKFSMVLSKNTKYRFTICNSESSAGKAIMQLFDENKILGTTFNPTTGKEYPGFDFNCTKTGVYHVFIQFQDGKQGVAVGILSFIEKL